jgi:hypothetical protein
MGSLLSGSILLFVVSLLLALINGQECPGICEDINSNDCASGFVGGLCPGPANIECCKMSTNCNGQCQDNSLPCSGQYVANMCPGPDNVQCCQTSPPGPPPPAGSCASFANAQWNCVDPDCSSTVSAGTAQPNYECAEFVARTLASAGLIPLDPLADQSQYGSFSYNGNTYDLLWVSSKNGGILGLDDYLGAAGWNSCGASSSCVSECSALMVDGSDGAYSHTVVGVSTQIVDAHNMARYQVTADYYNINNVWNPPSNISQIVAKQRQQQ